MKNEILRYVRPFVPGKEEKWSDALVKKANEFLDGFAWAQRRKNLWVAHLVPGVFGLFVIELSTLSPDIDQCIWVVVGAPGLAIEEPMERHVLLRHFLHRCVTKGFLSDAEVYLLTQFKLNGNAGDEIAEARSVSSNALRQKMKRYSPETDRME
jgi:hypothetical protein